MALSCDPQNLDSASRRFFCIPAGYKPAVNISLLNAISGVNASPQKLISLSTSFDSFRGITALGAEVYLLQQIAGLGSLSPSDLANSARCFDCGRDGDLSEMLTYLYAFEAGGSLDPAVLQSAATSYQTLFGIEWRVSLYLTCQWALMTGVVAACDPGALLNASRCYVNCLSTYLLRAIRVYLLCQIVNNAAQNFVENWAMRVVKNGGAAVSGNTFKAMQTFVGALMAASLDSLMITICCFVPDNLIAAITPLYVFGNDPWTNNLGKLVDSDLTINGLAGNGSNKFLNTGMIPANFNNSFQGSGGWYKYGLTTYNTTGNGNNEFDIGCSDANDSVRMAISALGTATFDSPNHAGSNRISVANALWTGYLSGNCTKYPTTDAAHDAKLYRANSVTPHAQIGSNVTNNPTTNNVAIPAFVMGANGTSFSTKRFSFAGIHQGLTAAQSLSFFNAIQALRVALGGGFV